MTRDVCLFVPDAHIGYSVKISESSRVIAHGVDGGGVDEGLESKHFLV